MVSKSELLKSNRTGIIQRQQQARVREQQVRLEEQKKQNIQQLNEVSKAQQELKQKQKELVYLRASYSLNDDRQGLRDVQAQQKQLNAQNQALEQIRSTLSTGSVYQNINQAISGVKSYGEQVYTSEVIRTSRPLTQKQFTELKAQTKPSVSSQVKVESPNSILEQGIALGKSSTGSSGGVFLKPSESSTGDYSYKEIKPTPKQEKRAKAERSLIEYNYNQQQALQFEQTQALNELIKEGQLPSFVRETFRRGGIKYFSATEKLRTSLGGKPLSQKDIEKGGSFIGGVGLGFALLPTSTSGALSKKQIAKLSESKFEGLGKALSKETIEKTESFISKVEKTLLNKKTLEEQLKYLKSIKAKLKPEQIKQWNNFVQSLIEKGFLKTNKGFSIFDFTPKPKVELVGATQPQLKQAGNILGLSTSTKQKQATQQLVLLKEETTQQTQVKQINFLGTSTAQTEKQRQKTAIVQRTAQTQAQPQKQKQQEGQKFIQSFLQGFKTTQIQKQIPKQQPRFKQPEPTIPKIKEKIREQTKPKILPKTSNLKQAIKVLKTKPELFEVFGRKQKKDIKLFSTTSKEEATERLKSWLKQGTQASGFITSQGKKQQIDFFGSEFRPSKVEPFRVVQKRKFRLGSFGERKEIQYFKKKGKKKKGRSIFL